VIVTWQLDRGQCGGVRVSLPPIAGWLYLTDRWRSVWSSLPSFSGTLVMLGLVLPWYVAAEVKTPGFLSYFLIGEHWDRFVVRGWDGDLYGTTHIVVPGTIWVYLLLGSFPWCLGLLKAFPGNMRSLRAWAMSHRGRGLYWILWLLWPAILSHAGTEHHGDLPAACLAGACDAAGGTALVRCTGGFFGR